MKKRASGILLHISSLPNSYGIGCLGKEAYNFIDFLKKAGQSYWQVLPIGPTGFNNSPYQTFSIYAGNPFFIDLDLLKQEGLLDDSDYQGIDFGENSGIVDYKKIFKNKSRILKKAYRKGKTRFYAKLQEFKINNSWVEEYSLFMALKQDFDLEPWQEWPENIKFRKSKAMEYYKIHLKDEMEYWIFLQYIFFDQWKKLKKYANNRGIKIIGDIPIYVALDSVDTWVNSELFSLDKDKNPIKLSGCPPDYFSSTGQLWGNPIYNWDILEESNFQWWIDRIRGSLHLYDIIRLDHFRGFESYWQIPFGEATAENGQWARGPGDKLFKAINSTLGKIDIIAEDLGLLTPGVIELRESLNYPGMKVLQFAFDDIKNESDYLPHNHYKNCVVYTGTHDNNTVNGWLESAERKERKFAIDYLKLNSQEGYNWGVIRGAWSSVANLAIAQMQDFLGLGSHARMNIPSTIENNWRWRMEEKDINEALAKKILNITSLYGRLGGQNDIKR